METIEIDSVREFWDRQPCNIKHGRAEVGTLEYFQQVSQKRYRAEPHIRKFADFPRWNGKRVLEIGCGIGTDAAEFSRLGALYTGVELSQESLNLAKERFQVEGLAGSFGQANAETIDNDLSLLGLDGDYDLIYSFGVLHHTPDFGRALRAIGRVADPETEIRIMVYAKHSLKNRLIGEGTEQPEAQTGCPIANTYSSEELHDEFEKAGLLITSIRQDHIFQWDLEKYKAGEFVKRPWFEVMPPELLQTLSSLVGWHYLVEARAVGVS